MAGLAVKLMEINSNSCFPGAAIGDDVANHFFGQDHYYRYNHNDYANLVPLADIFLADCFSVND